MSSDEMIGAGMSTNESAAVRAAALLAEVEQLRAALDDLNALTFENDDDEKCVREVIARAVRG